MKRTTFSQFSQDEAFGSAWEQKYMQSLNLDSYRKMEGRVKEFDYVGVKGKEIILYEIKSDRYAHKTGNLVVEFCSRGQPSGIQTSLADIWVFIIAATGEVFEVSKRRLVEAIHRQEYSEIREIAEGNVGYFFPLEWFRPFYCKNL